MKSKIFQFPIKLTEFVNKNKDITVIAITPNPPHIQGGYGYTIFYRE